MDGVTEERQGTHERLTSGRSGRMLATISLGWALVQAGRFLLSPLLPAIIDELAITEATAGVAFAALGGVYAVSQFPSGRLSDQWSRATLIVPGLVVLIAGFALFGTATSYLLFVVAAVVVGLGKGLFAIPARALVSDLYVERRGRALGVFAAGTDVGGLIASGSAAVVLATATWRTPFLPVAVALALLTALFVRWSAESYRVEPAELRVKSTVTRLLASGRRRRTLAAYSLFYFMVGGFINFFPTYLAKTKGFSPALASLAFAIVFAVGFVVKPVSGDLSDRFRRESIAAVGLGVAALALVVLVVVDARPLVWASALVLALGYKTQFPLADAIVMDGAPDGEMGADLGAARGLFLGVSALGPAYVGFVVTVTNYSVAFASLAACLLVAALLVWR